MGGLKVEISLPASRLCHWMRTLEGFFGEGKLSTSTSPSFHWRDLVPLP